jgi:flagellar basal-body rod protein FlgB
MGFDLGTAMFIDRLLNQGSGPVLEKMLEFTSARHELLAEDIVNVDTPNWRNKDLSLGKFQAMLQQRASVRDASGPGSIGFSDISVDPEDTTSGILMHDGNNRSMEQLMTDQAKNALMHNLVIELLRKQYGQMEMALKERVS